MCTGDLPGTYAIQVDIHETTTVALAVKPASECEREAEGDLRPIVWHQLESTSVTVTSKAPAVTSKAQVAEADWKPLKVGVQSMALCISFFVSLQT